MSGFLLRFLHLAGFVFLFLLPAGGTFTLWVNGKTTLDEEIQALEALDGVSYMTLM